ncbi:helix-turn-helix transcriptional regulator [Nostocoides vanveenii]|uniref:HTH cro/C1-type domain-containing protein n=1 Tax=Nostocoides vanveenii TaxID=330835 RepID=A0ABN2K6S8_9MICO
MRPTEPLPEPDLSSLRTAFDRARVKSGLTYDELAARTGLARRSLLDIAAGRNVGTLRTWVLIARALDVTLDDITDGVWK